MAELPHFKSVKDSVKIRGYSARVRGLANQVEIRDVVSALRLNQLDPAGRAGVGRSQARRNLRSGTAGCGVPPPDHAGRLLGEP